MLASIRKKKIVKMGENFVRLGLDDLDKEEMLNLLKEMESKVGTVVE